MEDCSINDLEDLIDEVFRIVWIEQREDEKFYLFSKTVPMHVLFFFVSLEVLVREPWKTSTPCFVRSMIPLIILEDLLFWKRSTQIDLPQLFSFFSLKSRLPRVFVLEVPVFVSFCI